MKQLQFFYREGCHLCEDMWQQLLELREEKAFALQAVSISEIPELETAYGPLIPVLKGGDRVLCHYYLDPSAVEEFLSSTGEGSRESAVSPPDP